MKQNKNVKSYKYIPRKVQKSFGKNWVSIWNMFKLYNNVSHLTLSRQFIFSVGYTGLLHLPQGGFMVAQQLFRAEISFPSPAQSVRLLSWWKSRPPLLLQAFRLIYWRNLRARRSPVTGKEAFHTCAPRTVKIVFNKIDITEPTYLPKPHAHF